LAYGHIYDTFYKKLYNYGWRIAGEKSLVEDCIQELFVRLWKQKEKLSVPRSIQAYLFESLRRCIFRAMEKEKREAGDHLDESYDYNSHSSFEMTLISQECQAEQRSSLERALESLTNRQREVIYLKFYLKMSYGEIAPIMGLNVESVYNLVSRALNILEQKLSAPLYVIEVSDYQNQ
jgi:RNA polymerase sigma factor (sigma-70 family)